MGKTFSWADMTISWGGVPVEGLVADGSCLEIEAAFPAVTSQDTIDQGVDTSVRVQNHFKFKIKLSQNSSFNDVFSSSILAYTSTKVRTPFAVLNKNGTSIYEGNAWVTGIPQSGFGTEVNAREWEGEFEGTAFVGGGIK